MTIDINELRRLAQAASGGPDVVSLNWIKPLQDFQQKVSPAVVSDLLDRLEATEKERDALRAKIEQMERQEPVGRFARIDGDGPLMECKHADIPSVPLYALPGAQPAPSEQDESVRKAWARFSNELHRSPDAPYPGMADAFEQHFSQSFIDREWRAEAATWAAAWKAAKRQCVQPAPSVPDGWKLVPVEPTPMMKTAGIGVEVYQDSPPSSDCLTWEEVEAIYSAMLAAAQEAKP